MANKKYNDFTTGTGPSASKIILIADPTTGALEKVTLSALGSFFGSTSGGGTGGDTTPPTVVSKTVENATPGIIDVVFSESVAVTTAGWSAKKNGSSWSISSVTGSGTTWHFTMGSNAANGDTLLISYDSTTGTTIDASANELVTFTDSSVTNNVSSATDSDASAFWTAAGITDTTQRSAINAFVIAAKANSYWTKLRAIYPIIGGDATKHSYNLKNPATYQITWSGTITHNSTGVRADDLGGTGTGYGNTGLNAGSVLTASSTSIGFLCKTDQDNGNQWPIGAFDSTHYLLLQARNSNTAKTYSGGLNVASNANSNSTGFYCGVRSTTTALKLYKNGSQIGTTQTTTDTTGLPSYNIYLLGINNAGTAQQLDYGKFFSFFFIGDALTDTDVSNMYTDVSNMQTTLGR